ncbi:hybrid sensor histidine kinase/response regulator [Haliea sp. AH-315-K21]|nr:hybrid sensor histidine kinase/response regulator [Haliea sp. AH-315-K21]MBN4075229.1 hybrid sensor histidine kinase/response regulator [Gammaproteobacteria bacterium AH-315-E17]
MTDKDELQRRVLKASFNSIHEQMSTTLSMTTLSAIGVFTILTYTIDLTTLVIWLSLICLCNLTRYLIDLHKHDSTNPIYLKRFYVIGSLTSGLLWASILIIASNQTSLGPTIILSVTMAISSTITLTSHAYYPPASYAFSIPSLLGMSVIFLRWNPEHISSSIAIIVMLFFILIVCLQSLNKKRKASIELEIKHANLLFEVKKQVQIAKNATMDKSRFLATVSHDLRQPFHALSLFVDSFDESNLNKHNDKILSNIKRSINAQNQLFTTFLDISMLDAGAITPNISCVSTTELLHELQLEYHNIASEKGLQFFSSNPKFFVLSDSLLCERIFRNILSNAVNHTSKGRISISVTGDMKSVAVSISDTGVGIKESDISLIFSDFKQLSNPENDQSNGLGLGLSTVKRLCSLLNIKITATSLYGEGSTFTVTFPRYLPSDQEEESLPPAFFEEVDLLQPTTQKISILIIDNDSLVLEATKLQLEALGHKTDCASNLEDTMKKIRTYDKAPDTILCDLNLGNNLLGTEVIETIRQHFKQNIPAIIITGDSDLNALKKSLNSKTLLFQKPLQKAKLVMALHALLKKR